MVDPIVRPCHPVLKLVQVSIGYETLSSSLSSLPFNLSSIPPMFLTISVMEDLMMASISADVAGFDILVFLLDADLGGGAWYLLFLPERVVSSGDAPELESTPAGSASVEVGDRPRGVL